MKITNIVKLISTGAFLLISAGSYAQRHIGGGRDQLGTPEVHLNNSPRNHMSNLPNIQQERPPMTVRPQNHFTPSAPVNTPRPSSGNFNSQPQTANRFPHEPARFTNNNYDRHYNNYYNNNRGHFYYNGAYHPRPYYYRPFRAPSFGIHINVLPAGYYPFRYRHRNYYYCNGIFYQPFGGYYETIAPPLGAVITILPPGAYFSTINNIGYYEYEGTYYQPYPGGGYEVAGVNGYLKSDLPPADESDDGDIISDQSIMQSPSKPLELSTLPSDYKTVVLNNITYYVSPSGEYYTKNIDENGKVTYRLSAAATAPKN